MKFISYDFWLTIEPTTQIDEDNEFEITGFDNLMETSSNSSLPTKPQFKNQYFKNFNENSHIHQNMMPNNMASANQMMQQANFIQQPQPGYIPAYNMGCPAFVPLQINPHFVRPQNMSTNNT